MKTKKLLVLAISLAMVLTMAVPSFAAETVTTTSKPTAVTNVNIVKSSYQSLKLTWSKVDGATKYEVFRSTTGKSGSFVLKKSTTASSYTNTGLTCGKTYYYKVRAVNSNGKGAFCKVVNSKVQPATAAITKIKLKEDFAPRVYWDKISGATGYQIYKKRTDKSTWKLWKTVSNKYNYATDEIWFGEEYYDWQYKVRAYRTVNGKKVYGFFSKAKEYEADWTIEEIYEELWKYGETFKFPMHEMNPDFDFDAEYSPVSIPKKDGSTYQMKHVIGHDAKTYEPVYTNPKNGNTKKPTNYEPCEPDNASWWPGWPVYANKYISKATILKDVKGGMKEDLKNIAKFQPVYWDSDWNVWSGTDEFTVYIEKDKKNSYGIWMLY